jgi:hypothetical protein
VNKLVRVVCKLVRAVDKLATPVCKLVFVVRKESNPAEQAGTGWFGLKRGQSDVAEMAGWSMPAASRRRRQQT